MRLLATLDVTINALCMQILLRDTLQQERVTRHETACLDVITASLIIDGSR